MKILIIGGGAREHAICWAIAKSPLKPKIYCAPGNAGISQIAENVPIKVEDDKALVEFAKTNQ
ncbi:MAG: phosphoribosylamine--glycine ligase, partial [Dongiaceae bacterium]